MMIAKYILIVIEFVIDNSKKSGKIQLPTSFQILYSFLSNSIFYISKLVFVDGLMIPIDFEIVSHLK